MSIAEIGTLDGIFVHGTRKRDTHLQQRQRDENDQLYPSRTIRSIADKLSLDRRSPNCEAEGKRQSGYLFDAALPCII